MKLLRLCAHEIRQGKPLPWAVRNEPGVLLLNKGFVISDAAQIEMLLERGVYVDAVEYEEEQQRQRAARASVFDPFSVWAAIHRQVGHLLRSHGQNPSFASDMDEVSAHIQGAIGKDVDVGKFEMVQNESPNYAVTHSLQTAFVAHLVAGRLGGSPNERQSVVSAALSMNIAMLDLQNTLVSQTTPPTPEQREGIKTHSRKGRERLEQLGVRNAEWLKAVEQHHVTEGGGPLPEQREHLSDIACLIHYVDVYLAKISARATRPALATKAAAQQLFLAAGGASNPYTTAIVKEMGIYPPGTFVKLHNGETAVVVRSGESAHTPRAQALVNGEGLVYLEPLPRDTAQPQHKIVSTVPRTSVLVRLNRAQLLGYKQPG